MTCSTMTTTEFPPGRTNRPWPARWPEWLGSFPRLTGRQWPEYESWHPGDESEGDQATRFAIRIGLWLLPWEWMIVRAVLSLLDPNEWGIRLYTHRIVVIEATRQQGKTLILVLIILWKLFKRRRRVVYTAQQWATVEDVFDRVTAIIDRVPSLKKRLLVPPSKKDNRGRIVLRPIKGDKHVVKAEFGPRTQHFARGFTELDDVIFDEAYDLVPKEVANLTGAQAASNTPQTIYASTPPVVSEHPNCGRFSGFVRTIKAGGAPGLYGVLYRAPKSFKRGDPAAYPLAQPSYGVVGNDRDMEAHLQGAKDAGPVDLALFDADWLGWGDYPPPANKRPSEIPAEVWEGMGPKPGEPRATLTGSSVLVLYREQGWAIVAAQRTTAGAIHIEVGYADDDSTAVVVQKLVEAYTAFGPDAVIVGRGAAAEVVPGLEAVGIDVTVPNSVEEAQACGGFLSDALDGRLSHSGQDGLKTAVASAFKRELPSRAFVWEIFDPASYAQLMGATLARWALLKFGVAPKRKTVAPRTAARKPPQQSTPRRRRGSDVDLMKTAF
jgi:hypothetical protein